MAGSTAANDRVMPDVHSLFWSKCAAGVELLDELALPVSTTAWANNSSRQGFRVVGVSGGQQ